MHSSPFSSTRSEAVWSKDTTPFLRIFFSQHSLIFPTAQSSQGARMHHKFCSHPPHPRAGCNGLPPLRATPPCCTTPSRRSQLATRRSCGHKITCQMWPSRHRHPFLPLHRGGCKGFGNEGLQEGVGSRIRGIGSILLLIITATLSRNTTDPP